ncbi:unnamed protein product [Arabidopsis thaliana]|uniref:Gnk2-homologous domain-containing protein n=1 Tax=Arabidopsis thaliana TaxID=3702 RepID=A0A5S9XEJ7_ARATH|nr:unnamed protein product [Arabidopsis thaliana]VYS58193.1 unnamed protein product [Arabidopsis thaliana]
MYSSCSLLQRLVWFPFLALVATQLLFIRNVSSLNLTNEYLHHKCLVSEGKYKPGSKYEYILNDYIRFLAAGNFRSGSMHMTSGLKPNAVTILYQCRGDSYNSKCRSCYAAGISGLRRRCPRNKGGIIWFDQCFVEITSISVIDFNISKINYENNFPLHNPNRVSGNIKSFNNETMALLKELALKANNKDNMDNGKMALYASGEKRVGTKKVYAMVQCMRDLVKPKMCKECLESIIKEFPECCDGKQGGRILGTSCDFRYELYPFLRTSDSKTV